MKTNNQWNNEHSNQLKENMLSAYNAMSEAEQKNIADLNNVELKDEFDRLELLYIQAVNEFEKYESKYCTPEEN